MVSELYLYKQIKTQCYGQCKSQLQRQSRHVSGDAPANRRQSSAFYGTRRGPVSLSQYKDKNLIISVFPSVDTSVCALQNIRFNKEASKLKGDVEILSISVDLPFAQKRFCAAEGIDNVHVYSDYRDLDFGMKYGFVIKELRLLARGVIVIDKKGIIRYIEYVPEIAQEPNYEAALKAVKELE